MIKQNKEIELEKLFELFPDGVVLIDTDTKLPVKYNKVAYTQLEYEEDEFKNISISDYEAIESPEDTKKHIEKIIQHGRDDFETQHKTKYGKILDIRVTIILMKTDEKIYFLSVFRDITKEKSLQRKIDEQNRFQKTLLENITHALITTDSNGIITSFNKKAEEILGYSADELLGKETPLLFHDMNEINERAKSLSNELGTPIKGGFEVFTAKSDQGVTDEKEWCYIRKDGIKIVVELTVTPLKDSENGIIGYLGIASDITQKKALEEKIKRENDAVNFILENTVGGYWDWDLKNNREYLSPGFKKMFGYEDHEMENLPESWMKIIFQEDLDSTLKLFDLHVKSKGEIPFSAEVRYRHKDGSTVWVICSGKVIEWDEEGNPLRMLGSHVDITQQKIMEQTLRESEQRFSDVAEASGEYIWELNNKGEYIFLTKPFEVMLGYTLEESLGRSPFSFMPPEEEIRVGEYFMNEIASSGAPFRGLIHQSLTKKGEIIWQKVNGLPMIDESGTVVGYRGAGLDITGEKKANNALEEAKEKAETASKAKSQFLANMSHEIRTPMNAVIGLGEVLSDMGLERHQKEILDKINGSSKMLLGIINDILDYSKIEAGKLDLEEKSFAVENILSQLRVIFSQNASKKNLELYFHLKNGTPDIIVGDEFRIDQVLTNLLSNALKFTHEGVITLTIELVKKIDESKALIEFSVEDSGIGMSTEQIDKLFVAFTQADSSTTRKYGGTGLGLVISKKIVEAMGGEMSVKSELGKGSRFSFSIVLSVDSWRENKERAKEGDYRVLIVDDQEISREILKEIVEKFGYYSDEACDGEEAISKIQASDIENRPYDIMIIDWNMPKLDGIETIKKVQRMSENGEIHSKIPTLFMVSAYSKNSIDFDEIAVDSFISKPITPSTLFDAIITAKKGTFRHLKTVKKNELPNFESLHILLVEDNEINQEVATLMLEKTGAKIDIANNGKEGVEKFLTTAQHYDLILMDLQMPIMSGYEASLKIREYDKKIPIIALTAAAMVEDKERALAALMNAHLGKPIEKNELYDTIAKHCNIQTTLIKKGAIKRKNLILDYERLKDGLSEEKINTLLLILDKELHKGEFKDIVKEIESKSDKAKNVIHALKGVSGNLCADELYTVTKEIDAEYKNSDSVSKTLIEKLKAALENLKNELKKREAIDDLEVEKLEIEPLRLLLKSLSNSLKEGKIIETQTKETVIGNLKNRVDNGILQRWSELIDGYDYDEALEIMQGWQI
jgi:two-component system, sensor histidine kinase and response regulator